MTVLLRFLRAFVPVATLWVGKLIVEAVEMHYRGGTTVDWHRVWLLVALELGIVILSDMLSRSSSLVEGLLAEHFTNSVTIQVLEHAGTLALPQFEDSEVYDQLDRARQQTQKGVSYLLQVLGLLQSLITVVSLIAGFVLFIPWLLLLLVVSLLPALFGEGYFASLGYKLRRRWTEGLRVLDYLRYVSANDRAAKEVRLFGLSCYLVSQYKSEATRFLNEVQGLAVRRATVAGALSVLGSLGLYAGYAVVVHHTITGELTPSGQPYTIGTMTFLVGSLRQSRALLQGSLLGLSGIYEQSMYMRDLLGFLSVEPAIRSAEDARALPRPIRSGIVFDSVGFRYPGSQHWAIRDLSFCLGASEVVALVGRNGAGKTTIVKLLTRLYEPDEGRILLDGVDLREYELKDLHRSVAVVFQDFQRFDFTFERNVGLGCVEAVEDHGRIRRAARMSGADSVAATLRDGYRQQLGRRFAGGVELSGGEWQKVALGRAYMRDAPILILDEPTAALDPDAEHEVFGRFADLTRDRLSIIISHRFSTVRMADRVLVLEGGSLIESGSHEHLLALGGEYAGLFHRQAAGYR